ncbi:peptidylprolyl isomerase [Chelatococcus composti]|uniref:Parvulin-like PPIase n=1 Tax=Chelatococcus composti TaxID=1743235 RepID=A0A841K5Y2_9HYPH|nr:peptidylprolyl isomerase [Chelatococcus composti]MBB6167450.1 peptidyl-prolyl cis-trans isomerase C [Chelatococcus composti]GGG32025.1 peptidylprolyl isomerase [Chelatococcus composti]
MKRFRPHALVLLTGAAFLAGAAAVAQTSAPAQPAPAQSQAADETKVLARVDGEPITALDLEIAAQDLGDRLPAMAEAQRRDYLIGYVIDLKLGAKAARAAKVDAAPDFERRVAYYRDKVLLDEYLQKEVEKAVTPEAARALYDETVKNLKPEDEVRARHILLENEEDAKKVVARLEAGEDFAKVAGEVSKDPGSAKEGGDLGYFTKDRMVKEFADAAFALEPGKVSAPVKSQFGWHVIKVEDRRVKPLPTFEEVKEQVEAYLARKAQQDLILGLRKDAKIERLDKADSAKPGEKPAEPKKN